MLLTWIQFQLSNSPWEKKINFLHYQECRLSQKKKSRTKVFPNRFSYYRGEKMWWFKINYWHERDALAAVLCFFSHFRGMSRKTKWFTISTFAVGKIAFSLHWRHAELNVIVAKKGQPFPPLQLSFPLHTLFFNAISHFLVEKMMKNWNLRNLL